MNKGHNIITTMDWLYVTINDKQLRIDSKDSLSIYSWRDYKNKPSDWFKIKPSLTIDKKSGYQKYTVYIGGKNYNLSRVVYNAHNPEWDITDIKNNEIDHININSLDNRIENLRILTHRQNSFNKRAKGYIWRKDLNKWSSRIMIDDKTISLGVFAEEADARNAYLEAKSLYHII